MEPSRPLTLALQTPLELDFRSGAHRRLLRMGCLIEIPHCSSGQWVSAVVEPFSFSFAENDQQMLLLAYE